MEAAHSEVGRGRIPKDKSLAVTTEGRTTNRSRLLKQEAGEGDCLEMNSRCVARVMGVNRDTAPPSLGIGQTGERLTRHSRERGKHRGELPAERTTLKIYSHYRTSSSITAFIRLQMLFCRESADLMENQTGPFLCTSQPLHCNKGSV